jgi:hypothetical protein
MRVANHVCSCYRSYPRSPGEVKPVKSNQGPFESREGICTQLSWRGRVLAWHNRQRAAPGFLKTADAIRNSTSESRLRQAVPITIQGIPPATGSKDFQEWP